MLSPQPTHHPGRGHGCSATHMRGAVKQTARLSRSVRRRRSALCLAQLYVHVSIHIREENTSMRRQPAASSIAGAAHKAGALLPPSESEPDTWKEGKCTHAESCSALNMRCTCSMQASQVKRKMKSNCYRTFCVRMDLSVVFLAF
jgi:hypothetical protein